VELRISSTLFLVILSLIVGILLYIALFFNGTASPPVSEPPLLSEQSTTADAYSSEQRDIPRTGVEISAIVLKDTRTELKSKSEEVPSACEKMGRRVARSLVSIVSPLGRATGFFIDRKGHILTIKQVAGYSAAELTRIKKEKEILDQIITLEQKRLRTIRQKMTLLQSGYEKEKYQGITDEKKKELFSSLARSQELDTLLKSSGGKSLEELTDIQVFSPDGTQLELTKVTLAADSDMALLEVNTAGLQYIPLRPRTIPFQSGDSVFSVEYLEQFSLAVRKGRVVENSETGICTDIQIEVGGSGGLLLDKYGNISGLNNGLAEPGRARDCAIPILAAYNEFNFSLIPQIRAVRSKIIVNGAML